MTPLAIALALFAQDAAAAAPAPAAPAAATEERWPTGAPREDYQFVAWCYGALRGYLDMHDEVMPEVTRIEKQFRKPGTRLEDDLKVYADMQKDGQAKLKLFQSAITAAEKASVRPINAVGGEAVKQGRSVWNAGPEVTKARKAQEWMSWALPARCETTAAALEQRATLAAATLRGSEPEAPAAEAPPAEQPAAETPPAS
jgi:GNAT superfamily N-acetyltransferase